MIRGFHERQRVDLGFEARDALVARLTLSGEGYREPFARYAFLGEVLRRVRALPGVDAAAATTSLPMSDELGGGWSMLPFAVKGLATPAAERPTTVVQAATAESFAALVAPRQCSGPGHGGSPRDLHSRPARGHHRPDRRSSQRVDP